MMTKLKKNEQKLNDIDKWSERLFNYMKEAFEDEFILHREDMDYKTKLWVNKELEKTYAHIYPILKNKFVSDEILEDLAYKLMNDIIFLRVVIKDDWDNLYDEIPAHYITILGYILIRAIQLEKFEICSNIKKFYDLYINQLTINDIIKNEKGE